MVRPARSQERSQLSVLARDIAISRQSWRTGDRPERGFGDKAPGLGKERAGDGFFPKRIGLLSPGEAPRGGRCVERGADTAAT